MTSEKMVKRMERDYGWHHDLCVSIADRLSDPPYVAHVWINLARDYPGIKLGEAAEIIEMMTL